VEKPSHSGSANADWPIANKSNKPLTNTSLVSLNRAMKVLTIDGILIFSA
jgi:hypothetical protein